MRAKSPDKSNRVHVESAAKSSSFLDLGTHWFDNNIQASLTKGGFVSNPHFLSPVPELPNLCCHVPRSFTVFLK